MKHVHAVSILVAVLVCIASMPINAVAVPIYSNDKNAMNYFTDYSIFSDELFYGEKLTEATSSPGILIPGSGYRSGTKTAEWDYVGRSYRGALNVNENYTIPAHVCIIVEADEMLVVEAGATLTVKGALDVYGTVVNSGTIVFDNSVDGIFGVVTEKPALIYNRGIVKNSGTIKISGGTFENGGTGKMENTGSIQISNKCEDDTLIGISNLSITGATTTQNGTITNTGTIYVKNEGGTGIKNHDTAVFKNEGTIYKTESGTINGTITGNTPKRYTES